MSMRPSVRPSTYPLECLKYLAYFVSYTNRIVSMRVPLMFGSLYLFRVCILKRVCRGSPCVCVCFVVIDTKTRRIQVTGFNCLFQH